MYFFPNVHFLLKYSWLPMFQVHSKVIQLYIYTYIIFEIIFYYRLLQDINYSSLWKESESCSVSSDSLWLHALYSPWNFPGQNTGVGSLSLLQGIFPTQGSNPGLLHCRRILYQLSHKGNPCQTVSNIN